MSVEEHAQLDAAARERGLTLSEWCREILLARGQETKPTAPTGTEAQALMGEIVALRSILLTCFTSWRTGRN